MQNTNIFSQTRSDIRQKDHARRTEAENLTVFDKWIGFNNGGSFLANHLIEEATELYDKRDKVIEGLKTKDDWKRRQREVKATLMEILGPFPERTPLRPAVKGIIHHDEYRIEKIVYESFPGYYVTGCLYVPRVVAAKVPAVLNLIGHEQESFRAELDQVVATNLAKKGMVVITIDPPGQGEHLQYFDAGIGFSSIGYSVVEHCYFGNQCFLSGISSARYFIWDAIRAIDYLVSRDDVDAERIGVTGFSGGGTITSYVAALDDRVSVSIPSSWSTSNRRQLQTKGAQDAEANLFGSLLRGITFEDLIEVRAPKPTMMTFVSRDEYLTLQGAREAYAEARRVYQLMNAEGDLVLVEDHARHWLTPTIRESIYRFFIKHFKMDVPFEEEDVDVFSEEQLMITPTGQISSSLGGARIFDINQEHVSQLMSRLQRERTNPDRHLASLPQIAMDISGYRTPSGKADPYINGRYQRDGYSVTKLALPGEGKYPVPLLLFVPDGTESPRPAIIYLHPDGKEAEAHPGGDIEKFVKQGYIVAAPDVPGTGELRNTATTPIAINYTAVLIGRSVAGIQAGAIVNVADYVGRLDGVKKNQIGALGIGAMTIPLVHAAAFTKNINEIALVRPLISYRAVATTRKYRIGLIPRDGGGTHHPYDIDFSWGIAGVLKAYDLPDLIACLAPRRVLIFDPQNENLQPASDNLISEDMAFPMSAYRNKKAEKNITLISGTSAVDTYWLEWFFR